ncbi:MAG: hypothetical protein K1Y01_05355 [Vicinamibacteria bacterium]|nr:hypothetical protein [Vicinamibacteria bacterium]
MTAPKGGSRVMGALLAFALLVPIGRGLLRGGFDLVSAGPYEARRNAAAFLGLDVRQVSARVDQIVGPTSPLSLGPSFLAERPFGADFWYQATYAFYPRRVVPSSSHILEIRRTGGLNEGALLGRIDDQRSLVLLGPSEPSPGSAGVTETEPDPWGIGVAAASVLGLGLLVRVLLRRSRRSIMEAILTGALALGIAAHLATWLQVPVPWRWLSALGVVVVALAAVQGRDHALRAVARCWTRRSPWGLLPLLVALLPVCRAWLIPPTEWDGRFIWLFHGAQLHFSGFLDVAESATLTPLQPTYPLLMPAFFSFGSTWREGFNERTAVLLGVLLHASVVAAIGRMTMSRMGAARGALFTSLCAGLSMGRSAEAYADGLLASTLVLEFLAFERAATARLGWLALACAALTKREGLPLALIVAVVQRGFGEWRAAAAWLSPALFHVFWSRFIGFSHEMDSPRLPLDLVDLMSRIYLIARKAAGVVARNTLYGVAAIGLVTLALRPVAGAGTAASARRVAVWQLGFLLITFLVTPQPLAWHLDTALSRLALHPANFAILSGFAAWHAAARSRTGTPGNPGGPAGGSGS